MRVDGDCSASFYYEGPEAVQKLEDILVQYMRNNKQYFPYTKIKAEAAKKVRAWKRANGKFWLW